MQFKKPLLYSTISLMSIGLILATSLATFSYVNEKPITLTTNVTNDTPSNLSTTNTDIDFKNTKKSNWTWPNNVYPDTAGYKFAPMEQPNVSVFKFDSRGFIVDKNYPRFSKTGQWLSYWNGYRDWGNTFNLPPLTTDLNINYQNYDLTSSNVQAFTKFNRKMIFGNSPDSTLTGMSDYLLSRTRPYMTAEIPIVDYKGQVIQNGGAHKLQAHASQNGSLIGNQTLRYINNNDRSYNGNKSGVRDPVYGRHFNWGGGEFDGMGGGTHMDVGFGWYKVTISMFNDYDSTGKHLATYMLNDRTTFNSVLPTISIDETKFNKNYNALRQDLSVNELVTLVNAQSIPSLAEGTVTAASEVAAGKITFTYKPAFIFNNGTLQKYDGVGTSLVVSGFSLLNTFISSIMGYPSNIVVDRFMKSVTNEGAINISELAKYLDFSTVPTDAIYTIPEDLITMDLVKGIINFSINASNGYNYDDTLTYARTPNYSISLQLTPRITKIDYISSIDDLLVTEFYNKVFDKTGLVNLAQFNKYAKFIAPVDNANYYLVPDSYDIHTGDGTINFKIFADKFYNSKAEETVGGADVIDSQFSVSLNLRPAASIMQVKSSYAADIRVDKFIASLGTIGADGVIADPTILKQYIDLENIPSTAQYKISNIKDGDFNKQFIRNDITFDLTVTDFNQADGIVTPQTKTLTLTLGDQHMTTDIVLLDASLFPKDATPSKFKARMEKDGAVDTNGTLTLTTANIEFLSKFLDFNSIPKDTVYAFTYNPVAPIDATEKLGFSLVINQYYDANSDLLTIPKAPYDFVLDLASEDYIPDPTILVTHAGSPVVNTEKDFLEQVYFDQKADLHNLSLYVDGLETIPTTADITIIKHQDSYNKVATFMIEVSGYYDGESSQMHVGPRTFNFQVNINNYQNPFSWWWWLVIAVGVTGAIGLLIWIPIHKWRKIKQSDLL